MTSLAERESRIAENVSSTMGSVTASSINVDKIVALLPMLAYSVGNATAASLAISTTVTFPKPYSRNRRIAASRIFLRVAAAP